MNKIPRRTMIAVMTAVFFIGGLIAGLVLINQRQLIPKKAAVPGGIANIRIAPETKNVSPGESFTADIYFTTGGVAISAITAQLDYVFDGAEPPLTVSTIVPDAGLGLQNWSFPVTSVTEENGRVKIQIAAINLSTGGFSSDTESHLASLTFAASNSVSGGIITTFDATQSKITQKDTAQDILLIPTSSGLYEVQSGTIPTSTPIPTSPPGATPTPTPGYGGGNPTSTPIPTSPPGATPTPTPGYGGGNPTMTPTPTVRAGAVGGGSLPTAGPTLPAELPVAGNATPGIMILLAGIMMAGFGGWLAWGQVKRIR